MRTRVCAAALLGLALVTAGLAAQTKGVPDLKGRDIRVVTEGGYPPLSFLDPVTGKPAGLDSELLAEIGKRLNARITWSKAAWADLLNSVHEGRFDIAANGITITEDRREQVDFSDPYLVSQQRMVARADEARFSNAAQLGSGAALLLGAQAGAAGFYAAAYNVLDGDEKSPRIMLVPSAALAVRGLLDGAVDCVLMEEAGARGFVGGSGGKLKVIGEALAREPLALAITPGSDLTAAVNAAIRSMREDGTLVRLATRWFYDKADRHGIAEGMAPAGGGTAAAGKRAP